MLEYSSYGARNRHLGGPTTDAGETPSPLEKLLLNSRENAVGSQTPRAYLLELASVARQPYQLPAGIPIGAMERTARTARSHAPPGCRPVESARRNRGGGPVRESVRPTLPVVGVVLAVVALVLGASVVQAMIGIPAQEAGSGHGADQPAAAHRADPTTLLDLGQVSSSEQVATCLSPSFAADPSQVQVLYGVQQRAVSGSSPVFVLRNRSGALRLCDEFGGEPPSQSPLPSLSDTRPVAFLSNGRSTWRCDGQALRRLQMTSWLLVSPDVRTVQQRYWVDGTPGPWFTTRAQSGFAHLQSWLTGRHRAGAKYATQYRVT